MNFSSEEHKAFIETFATASGREVLAVLQKLCYSVPSPSSPLESDPFMLAGKSSRQSLFRTIQYLADGNNLKEPPTPVKRKGVFSDA